MAPLPYPQSPTEQEVAHQEHLIRWMRFMAPAVIVIGLMVVAIITAVCISYNFNPMNWLE